MAGGAQKVSSAMAGSGDSRLRVTQLTKTFDSARVLHDAAISVGAGEIHALVGANGSGKSTFVKCITGVHVPDPGAEIELNGSSVTSQHSPDAAFELGVRVVHQEAPLIDALTLADLTALHRGFPTRFGAFVRQRALIKETRRILERLSIEMDPELLASKLSAAERAMFTLALALSDSEEGARLLVLDEATASLPTHEATRFLDAVMAAAAQGAGVLLVTHRLAEVLQVSQRVTVLRDGEVVFSGRTSECTHDSIVEEIVGPERDRDARASRNAILHAPRFTPKSTDATVSAKTDGGRSQLAPPLLEIHELNGSVVHDCSFDLAWGEMLGVSGILGSGVDELGRLIAGVERRASGSLRLAGADLSGHVGPRQMLHLGVVYVPADRLKEGGIGSLSMRDNVSLPSFARYWMRGDEEEKDVNEVINVFSIRPPEPSYRFGALSGGNQQKVILGRWALIRPQVWVLDDPTAGVDPGAREDIYAVLRGLAAEGVGVIFISSEPEQLARVATRVLVMKDGAITTELNGNDITERAISRASL